MKLGKIRKNITEFREFFGWSQRELARRCKITQADMSQIERGERDPSLNVVIKMSKAFRCSTDRVIYGKEA